MGGGLTIIANAPNPVDIIICATTSMMKRCIRWGCRCLLWWPHWHFGFCECLLCDSVGKEMQTRGIVLLASSILVLGLLVWTSDSITLQGERTVYTAECHGGDWQGERCTGNLIAGQRFRFRALKAHREVLFWTVGSSKAPSGKFTDCTIQDGRNWRCKANSDLRQSITLEMSHGQPVPDSSGIAHSFHQIPKWRWLLLRSLP